MSEDSKNINICVSYGKGRMTLTSIVLSLSSLQLSSQGRENFDVWVIAFVYLSQSHAAVQNHYPKISLVGVSRLKVF